MVIAVNRATFLHQMLKLDRRTQVHIWELAVPSAGNDVESVETDTVGILEDRRMWK